MWDVFGAVQSVADAVKGIFDWATGGRSRDENALRKEAESAHEDFTSAVDERDAVRANRARAEQRKLRDEAKSKRK